MKSGRQVAIVVSGEFASRLCGSSDIFGDRDEGRRPSASINFVTVHDGFTLADLVSYNAKHNDANGENNQDGENNNQSWNCGAEGPTDDAKVNTLRRKQRRTSGPILSYSYRREAGFLMPRYPS